MKNQFNRSHRHNNTRSVRSVTLQQITRFTNLDSSGPLGKLRGTPLQLAEKYQDGAKDAQSQGDVVLFQTCQQYADHYLRLQSIAIENEQPKIQPEELSVPQETEPTVSGDASQPQQVPAPTNTVIEKRPATRHKKADDSLSVPVDALQEKSEITQ